MTHPRPRRAASKRLGAWGLAIVGVLVAWLGVSVAGVLIVGAMDQRPSADAIIVLGAAQYVGRPSPVLRARLDHAAQLWREGLAPLVIVTGGIGVGDTTSEAEVGRTYLIARGVADTAILLERAGRTSGQSLGTAARMLHDRGRRSAILVSDPFHALRVRILAWRHGIVGSTSPTRTSPIERNARARWRYVLSEAVKLPVAAAVPRR